MARRGLAALALLGGLWSAAVWITDGFSITLAGVRIASHDAARPLLAAIAAAVLSVLLSGAARTGDDLRRLRARLRPGTLAVLLAAAVLLIGVRHNSWSAGASDSFSYVTQSGLWLSGTLTTAVPVATAAPWPRALATFTPLGYVSSPRGDSIVPMTAPGLPLLMAAFRLAGGYAAGFLVVPITGALLVWTTFAIGRRIGSGKVRGEAIGLGGAWLVATSPTFLMMYRAQMADVPAAACWALATLFLLRDSTIAAVLSGLAASMAILIRPNLVPIAAVMGAWLLWGEWRRSAAVTRAWWVRPLLFITGMLPGCLAVAWMDAALYGSPLASGYGDLHSLFSFANIPANVARYGRWLIETQTPLAAIAVPALLVAPRRIWPTAEAQSAARLLGLSAVVVWAQYWTYLPFEAWWFLRFMLPSWPAIALGSAALVIQLVDWPAPWAPRQWAPLLAGALVIALGLFGVATALSRDVFPANEGERRYATIAQLVGQETEPSSAILTGDLNSGPVRYYAGRMTLRFDLLDEAWLDRAVDWLRQQGRHVYFMVEDWELPQFERRFAARNRLGRLQMAPILAYRAYNVPGTVYLFDPLKPDGPTRELPPIRDPRPLCVRPVEAPALTAAPALTSAPASPSSAAR